MPRHTLSLRPASGIRATLRRRLARFGVEWLISHPGAVPKQSLQRWTGAIFDSDRDRHIVVNELKERIKARAPGVDQFPMDLEIDQEIGFENLVGLFSSTTLDEYIATMNVRQAAYLFGLIRRMNAKKVIEIGRHWGGSAVVIAAAMRRKGEFWSIADPAEIEWDIEKRGRTLDRPVEDQVARVCSQFGITAHIVADDPRTVEVETGEVDLVMIDGDHTYEAAMSDFSRFGLRVRLGGAVLFDDAVYDDFCEPAHTAGVKRVVADVARRGDFREVKTVKRLVHFERVA